MMPNMDVWRPCDTVETIVAWVHAVENHDRPDQPDPVAPEPPFRQARRCPIANISRGGYVLKDAAGAKAIIIATGSEIELALKAQEALAAAGTPVRVVSMPSTNTFDKQDAAYQQSVLTKGLPRVAVEAGVTGFWRKYVGLEGAVVGIDTFGESAPAGPLFKHFGFTPERVIAAVKSVL